MSRDQTLQLRATQEQRQLIDQAAAAEGISRSEFILRSCQERAQTVLLDQTFFSLNDQQSLALLADLHDQACHRGDQIRVADLLTAPQPWDAAS